MSNILVVDDDYSTRKIMQHYIEKAGYFVMTANSGEEALEKKYEEPPDLIILDRLMGGMDGFEVVNILKAEPTTEYIRVIMLTSCDNPQDITAGLDAGADDYITKPFNPEILLARVRSQLRIKAIIDYLLRENNLVKELLDLLSKDIKGLNEKAALNCNNNETDLQIETSIFKEKYSHLQKQDSVKDVKWSEELEAIAKKGINSILFVCNANLFRSPIATLILNSKLEKMNLGTIDIQSTGIRKDIKGNKLSEKAINDLLKLNIDLSQHRSSAINKNQVQTADIILVMEKEQLEKLNKIFPFANEKTFMLSNFRLDGLKNKDIADPIGANSSFLNFRLTSYEISIAINGFINYLSTTNKKITDSNEP